MAIGNRKKMLLLAGWIAISLSIVSPAASVAGIAGQYLYSLSNFTGTVRHGWARPYFDSQANEIYVAEGGIVRIYNSAGMEIYRFGDGGELGSISDVAVDSEGNILTLSWRTQEYYIAKCNFRGEVLGETRISNLPGDFADFSPNRMIYRGGRFFLVDKSNLRVVVVNRGGVFEKGYDLAPLVGVSDKDRQDNDIFGFYLDGEENMLFTIPVQFKAYKVTSAGKASSFGQRGSGPGKFGVAAGIAVDAKGNILVADTLRCVVMIFNKDFRFQSEFGYRGFRPGKLIAPRDLEVDGSSRVFVTQSRRRGISVYTLSGD